MIHDYGMSTMVGQFLDLAKLTTEQRLQFYRLRRWQTRTRVLGSRDRNLTIALSFLIAMCDELTIPKSVQEYAAKTYRMAFEARLVRGRTISSVAAASLYFACRVHGVTRTLKDIASTNVLKSEVYTVRESELGIAKDYRMMHQRLNLKTPIQTALPFVAKICAQLELPSTVEQSAAELLQEYRDKKLSAGRSQKGLAAAAIYIACRRLGVKVTQKELASVAQVTEVTIRNRYKGMVADLKIGNMHLKNTLVAERKQRSSEYSKGIQDICV
jgi:transcription initiation factor TFIIB